MFSHVHLGITNFERSFAFYSAIMSELGFELKFCRPDESWAGWIAPGKERPLFLIGLPYDRQPASAGNGGMTAFLAPTREVVDYCHAVALGMGGRCEWMPGPRPHVRGEHADGAGARVEHSAHAARPRRRGDRIERSFWVWFAAMHESASGPTRTSRNVRFISAIGGIADLKGVPDTPGLP
jgi:catechol 2,3-dioxygenase-like lactoylglutathione lyase family enzyme